MEAKEAPLLAPLGSSVPVLKAVAHPSPKGPWIMPDTDPHALLAQMDLEEKRAQLSAFMFFDSFWHQHDTFDEQERIDFIWATTPDQMMGPEGLGFITTIVRDLPPRMAAEIANRAIRHAMKHTRCGVPPIIHDEGVHGLIGNGATCFPSALGMAAAWDPELLGRVADAIGREARSRGVRQLLSPTLNLARDPRCGRVEETYGEDPFLASRCGVEFVKNVQVCGVACTPKHFVLNFESDGGRDSAAADCSERGLRETYFVPFEAAVTEGGAFSLMAAYNSLNGVPCSGSEWLLTKVLRQEWGFGGTVVADYHSVVHQWELHRTARDRGDAAVQALSAGLDVELPRFDCYGVPLRTAMESDETVAALVEQAAERVLRLKEELGVLEAPFADPDEAERVHRCEQHRALAREMALQSFVLLKNEAGVLPFAKNLRSLAVVGPNADSVELGDYSWDLNDGTRLQTPLAGLRSYLEPRGVALEYARGCGLEDGSDAELAEAVGAAERADAVVAFVGSSVKLAGEARDRRALDLPGRQAELIRAVTRPGKPVAVVLITGGVHTMEDWIGEVPAVMQAWYGGEQGAAALAAVLFGDEEPGGRLPVTIPRTMGQLPLTYDMKPSGRGHRYAWEDGPCGVQFPFGFGLGYGDCSIVAAELEGKELRDGGTARLRAWVSNNGDRPGRAVVQVYARRPLCSVVQPERKLIGFSSAIVPAGEDAAIPIEIRAKELHIWSRAGKWTWEPGEVKLQAGLHCLDEAAEAELHLL